MNAVQVFGLVVLPLAVAAGGWLTAVLMAPAADRPSSTATRRRSIEPHS